MTIHTITLRLVDAPPFSDHLEADLWKWAKEAVEGDGGIQQTFQPEEIYWEIAVVAPQD